MNEVKPISAQDRQNAFNEFCKDAERWRNRVIANILNGICKGYRRGDHAIICKLEPVLGPRHVKNKRLIASESARAQLSFSTLLIFHPDMMQDCKMSLCDQQLMFIDNIQAVKGANGIPIPSKVGLYFIEHDALESDDGLLLFSLFEKSYKFFSLREAGKIGFGFELLEGVGGGQLEPSVIESSPDIVDGISNHKADFFRYWDGVSEDYFREYISRFCITVEAQLILPSIAKVLDHRINVTDVLLGPFEF